MKIFDSTTLKCKQLIHLGIYHPSSRFFFIADDTEKEFEFKKIFNDYFSQHPQVGIIQRVRTKDIDKVLYKIYGFNLFVKENRLPIVKINYIWTNNNTINHIKDVFSDRSNFQGKHLTVVAQRGIEGYAIQVDKIPIEDPEYSPTTVFRYVIVSTYVVLRYSKSNKTLIHMYLG